MAIWRQAVRTGSPKTTEPDGHWHGSEILADTAHREVWKANLRKIYCGQERFGDETRNISELWTDCIPALCDNEQTVRLSAA
jgi:hypothetical protein